MSSAARRAFHACPETCPTVNVAAADLETIVNAVSGIERAFDGLREADGKARDALREALIQAYQELEDAESEIASLQKEVERLERLAA